MQTDVSATYEPLLTFSPVAWRKLVLYTTLCLDEIGGFGIVEQVGSDYRLDDLLLVRQEVSALATHFRGQSVSSLIEEMVAQDRDPAALRLWWHSHAREAPFWSGEDERTISNFRNDGMLSLVSNHEMRLLARMDHYVPRATAWVRIGRPSDVPEATPDEVGEALADIETAVGAASRSSTQKREHVWR